MNADELRNLLKEHLSLDAGIDDYNNVILELIWTDANQDRHVLDSIHLGVKAVL